MSDEIAFIYSGIQLALNLAGIQSEGSMMDIDFTMILFFMDGLLFVLGVFMVLVGIAILAKKAFGKEVQVLASTTSKLARKGIADDIAGLVGNASALMNALQEMIKTARGIGTFLILTGGTFITSSLVILIKYILV